MKIHSLGCQVKDGLVVGGFDEKGREVYIIMMDRPMKRDRHFKDKIAQLSHRLNKELQFFLTVYRFAEGLGLNKGQLKKMWKKVNPIIDRLLSS